MDRGSMGLLLKISRPVGIAPVKYAPEFQVSRNMIIFGRVFMIINGIDLSFSKSNWFRIIETLILLIILGLFSLTCIAEFYNMEIYFESAADDFVKSCAVAVLAVMTTVGVFTAPARLTSMDNYFKRLNQIDAKLQNILKRKILIKSKYKILIVIAGYFFLRLIEIGNGLSQSQMTLSTAIIAKEMTYMLLNVYILVLLQLQISFLAQRVNITLIAVNDALKTLLFDDASAGSDRRNHVAKRKNSKEESKPHIIREIAISYVFICEVVIQTTRANGVIMMLAILFISIHLEVQLYRIITTLISSSTITIFLSYTTILFSFWCICSISFIIYYIEQFHQTHYEMQRTHNLIIDGRSKENEKEVENELELFSRILILNNASYSPLSMFTIDRPLMMKLFGGLTTYLVIILQYGDRKEITSQIYNNVTGKV